MHHRTRTRLGPALFAGALAVACGHVAPAPPEQSEERRLAGENGWLLGSDLGLGPSAPVLFMHGVGGDHRLFDSQLREFRTGRRVLAFDQRGCGGSADAPGGAYDLDIRVRDLGLVLDALRLDPVVLVGHGTGGEVMARYAERNPSRVLGLVLIDPVSRNAEAGRVAKLPESEFRPAVEAWLETLLHDARPETRNQVIASAQTARVPAMRAMLLDAAGTALVGSLARYPGPVLVLAAQAEAIPDPLPAGVETRRLPSGSHWLPLDAPEEVNAALKSFLKPIDAAALERRRAG